MSESALPSRIMMTSDSIGGVWTYALDLARWFGALGIEVVLVNMGRKCTSAQHREAWSVPTLTLVELPLKLEWMDEPWEDVDRAGEELLKLERQFRPDLVHLNGYAHGDLPFDAPSLVVAHSCVLSWWRAVHGEPAPPRYDTYRARVKRGLASATRVVGVSRFMRDALESNYGFHGRSQVIYNGADPALHLPDVKEALVFGAGRFWDAAKNLIVLNACARHVPWPIVAAGDDTRPPGVNDAAPLMQADVRMLGPTSREETARWMSKAAIYALPARYEPFGLSVLEAALSGCALVLGDIPSLRELWDGTASFVDPNDEAQVAAAIRALIDSPHMRADLASRSLARAERLTLTRMAESYLALYQAMANTRTRAELPALRPALQGG